MKNPFKISTKIKIIFEEFIEYKMEFVQLFYVLFFVVQDASQTKKRRFRAVRKSIQFG